MKNTVRLISYSVLLFFLLSACKKEQPLTSLPRGVPEKEGVSSKEITGFLDAVAKSRNEMQSFMLLRHGKVVAEGWWNPYKPEMKHTLYSTSKSFTATAVGFAISEKKFTVDDKVISFFPDQLPDTVSAYLKELKIKDLLSMSAGQDPDPTFRIATQNDNWIKAFLATPVINQPGSKFLYNSLATYMLSAIVQKVTGEKVLDYLKPRLFEPLAIEGEDWETDPEGINTGGWGLRLKTEDMAKFGQLFLQKGKWNGQQIIPSAWVEEASTKKIEQTPDLPQVSKDSSDWRQGYCYQMWRCRHNAFRADGAYGQYIIVIPEKDAVIAINSETADMQDEINLVWDYLLPAIKDEELPLNEAAEKELSQRLAALALPLPVAGTEPSIAKEISGKKIILAQNDLNLSSVKLGFAGAKCEMEIAVDTAKYSISSGRGQWINGTTDLEGPNLLRAAKGHNGQLKNLAVASAFGWTDEKTLHLILRYIESPHSQTLDCIFDKGSVTIRVHNSNEGPAAFHQITGSFEK